MILKFLFFVQCPSTLATCVLAQLQEEAMGAAKRPYWRFDALLAPKSAWPSALPLPPPPLKATLGDVKRLTDTPHSSADEKFQALRASRALVVCVSGAVLNGAMIINALRWYSYILSKNCLTCF